MTAATFSLGSSVHNLANLGTAGFRRELVAQEALPNGGVATRTTLASEPGSAIEADVVGLLAAQHSFLANLAVFRASDRMAGTLLDIVA